MKHKLLLNLAIIFLAAVKVIASEAPTFATLEEFTALVTGGERTLTTLPSVFSMPSEESLREMSPTELKAVGTASKNTLIALNQRYVADTAFNEGLEEICNVAFNFVQSTPLQSCDKATQTIRLKEFSDRLFAITHSDLSLLPTPNVPSTPQSEVGEVMIKEALS